MRGRWARYLVLGLIVVAVIPLATRAQDCDVRGTVETPPEGASVQQGVVTITGWAADLGAPQGTGITAVRIALDADPEQGGVALPALYGWERPDIAALLGGPRYLATGFAMSWDASGLPPGSHTLYVQVRNACGWTGTTRSINLLGGGPATAPSTGAPAGPAPTPSTQAPRPTAAASPAATPASGPTRIVLPTSVPVSATSVPTPDTGE